MKKNPLFLDRDIQKIFMPLGAVSSGDGRKFSTAHFENDKIDIFGYYESAAGISGNYFNYIEIDEKHFATISCHVAGKDSIAILIIAQIDAIFSNFCKNINLKEGGDHLKQLVEDLNDQIESLGLKGRTASLVVSMINIETGTTLISSAGMYSALCYGANNKSIDRIDFPPAPAAGEYSSDIIKLMNHSGKGGFHQDYQSFLSGDILFFLSDGIIRSSRIFHDRDLNEIKCDGCAFADSFDGKVDNLDHTHNIGSCTEEFGSKRIRNILFSILNGGSYELLKNHNPFPDKEMSFNFRDCRGSVSSAVQGLVAVEKVFRFFPDPHAGPEDKIVVDKKIDSFLRTHFDQYDEYCKYSVQHPEFPEYLYYTHLKESVQCEDLTILAVKRKVNDSIDIDCEEFGELTEIDESPVEDLITDVEYLKETVSSEPVSITSTPIDTSVEVDEYFEDVDEIEELEVIEELEEI